MPAIPEPEQPGTPPAARIQADVDQSRIASRMPGWVIWYVRTPFDVHRISWSAMPGGATMAVITAADPDSLLARILDRPSWLPGAISDARARLESTPPDWTRERTHLTIHLESLLREQHAGNTEKGKCPA